MVAVQMLVLIFQELLYLTVGFLLVVEAVLEKVVEVQVAPVVVEMEVPDLVVQDVLEQKILVVVLEVQLRLRVKQVVKES